MRVGSLFTGYGGLDLAVGGDLAWYAEIEPAACTVLAHHYPDVPNLGDITQIDWNSVEPVDVLTGGYPCQPFSHAGKRAGTDDERHLWPYVATALRTLRPMVGIFENVDGHRSLGLDVVLGDLAEMGRTARWGVVRAADAGAPHSRARVFIATALPDQPGSQRTDARMDVAARRSDTGRDATQGDHGTTADTDGDRYAEARGTATTQTGGASGTNHGRDRIPAALRAGEPAVADADRDGHGSELHAPGVGGVEGQAARSARQRQRAWGESDPGSIDTPTDTDSASGETRRDTRHDSGRVRLEPVGHADTDWGKYGPAVRRWEALTRPAPDPTTPGRNDRPRLNPRFVEWMMGLPDGWVTGHGLRPSAELKMLGNGVCPQQARLALDMLAVAA